MKIADAFVEIRGDKGKFSATIRSAKRETTGFAKSATKSLKRVSIGLGLIATAAIAASIAIGIKLTRAIIRMGKATIEAAVRYDKLKIGLKAVAGSSEEAARQLVRLEKVSKLPGLSFEGAIQGSTALQAAGLSAELSERSLLAFGNALVTVGKGADDLKGVNLALTQIVTKGAGFGQELRQLSERLPQVRKAMKAAFGISSIEDFQKLGLTADDFIEGLVVEFEKLPKVSGTVANSLENLGIAFDRLKAEIGNTMLSITRDTADSLTSIIDKIREIIPHWKLYQDIAGEVFTNIATIGFNATVAMFKSIMKITGALGKVVWVPLLHGFVGVLKDIDEKMGKWAVDMAAKLPFISQEWADRIKKDIDTAGAEWDKFNKIITDAKIQMEIAGFAKALRIELANMVKELNTALPGIEKQLDRIIATLPEKTAEAVKKTIAELEKIQPGEVDFLKLKTEDPKKEVQRQIEALKRIADFRKQIMDETTARGQVNLEKFRGFLRQQEEAAQAVADAIRPIFENMFQGLFSGNTKNLWQEFWTDLKRIAMRQMATIFATQILSGLLTGGASFAGIGLGSALSALAPKSIDPTSRAIGGAVRGGARAVGGFLEGGTINIMDQDLRNFDQQRLTKQVEQGIGPALSRAAADGITS